MSQLLGEVNQRIRDLATQLDPRNESSWEFICECGDDGCTERVGLALDRYDTLKRDNATLLAPGHALKRPA
jgi:hypothetical protein